MFLLSAPDRRTVERFLDDREDDSFSYAEVGATAHEPPPGYNIDHNRQLLGTGRDVFGSAKQAVREWKMFDFPWIRLVSDETPIETGRTVAIVAEHLGFYSINASRIVYTIDEEDRFGFAYGTLTEHAEIGEERFLVEFDVGTGNVWYDLFAFSRPGSTLAWLGYPISRYFQMEFAAESKAAMLRAITEPLTAQNND